jgi:hypothetical protein
LDAEAITAVCLGLSKLRDIRTLKFDVGTNFIKDAGATCVLAYLAKLNELKNLSVDLMSENSF